MTSARAAAHPQGRRDFSETRCVSFQDSLESGTFPWLKCSMLPALDSHRSFYSRQSPVRLRRRLAPARLAEKPVFFSVKREAGTGKNLATHPLLSSPHVPHAQEGQEGRIHDSDHNFSAILSGRSQPVAGPVGSGLYSEDAPLRRRHSRGRGRLPRDGRRARHPAGGWRDRHAGIPGGGGGIRSAWAGRGAGAFPARPALGIACLLTTLRQIFFIARFFPCIFCFSGTFL